MISVKNLTKIYKTPEKKKSFIVDFFAKEFKEFRALDNISFDIGAGELVGFIGPNGAGKTTTMKTLAGILYPTSGEVNVLGFNPFEKKHEFLKQIAFVMGQKNQLIWDLPAMDAFKLNKEIYNIPDKDFKQTLNDLTDLLDADEYIHRPVKTLSLGQRMRVELISSLLHKPKILFLDEPTIGLDIFAQTTVTNFIKEYQQKYESTIMLTSHYMQDVQRLAKRILVIDHGKLIFDGALKDLIEKYSNNKTITITLDEEPKKAFHFPEYITYEYQYPQLKINVKKDNLTETLTNVLKEFNYSDVNILDEPLEEIIKKIFQK